MATVARLPFSARRNELRTWTMRFVGVDWSASTFAMEVRLAADTPGPARLALGTVTTTAAEGLKVVGVTIENGLPVTTVTGRINKTTMGDTPTPTFPYAGELGDDAPFIAAVQVDGITRLIFDPFWVLATAFGSDSAPSNRPASYGSQSRGPGPWSTASLTFGGDDIVEVSIDGTELLGPIIANAVAIRDSVRPLFDTGAPASGLGVDGQLYYDLPNGLVYGPKTAGSWGAPHPMRGGPGGDAFQVGTYIEATGVAVPDGAQRVYTTGRYSKGDRGGAFYTVVDAEPAHPGKIQFAAGKWGELEGPLVNVRQFGAKGDCPDVTGIAGQNQAAIAAAISGATNDLPAFVSAMLYAKARPGTTVQIPPGIYRIGYNSSMTGLGVPDFTTFEGMPGSVLEIDPSNIVDILSLPGLPPKRGYLQGAIGPGDPVNGSTYLVPTGTVNGQPLWFPATYVSGGQTLPTITLADFVQRTKFIGLRLRQSIRTSWETRTGVWRCGGISASFSRDTEIYDCQVEGSTSDGIYTYGGFDISVDRCKTRLAGYGAQQVSPRNGMSFVPIHFVGLPDLSSHALMLGMLIDEYAQDESFAIGPWRTMSASGRLLSKGPHDRAVEMFYQNITLDSAALGEQLNVNVDVRLLHDGLHVIGSGTVANGSLTTLTMPDVHYVTSVAAGNYFTPKLFIGGAGPGGSDGPFTIVGLDPVANTVTISPAATAPVAGAKVYTKSNMSAAIDPGNDGRTSIDARIRNVYNTSIHGIVSASYISGGVVKAKVFMEDVDSVNTQAALLVDLSAENVELDLECGANVNVASHGGSFAMLLQKWRKAKVKRFSAQSKLWQLARVNAGAFPDATLTIRDAETAGMGSGAIVFDGANPIRRFRLLDSALDGLVQSYPGVFSAVYLASVTNAALTFGEITISRCSIPNAGFPLTGIFNRGGIAAGAISKMVVENNDWGGGNCKFTAGLASIDNSTGVVKSLIDRNNKFFGQRDISINGAPVSGSFGRGDIVRDPTAGIGGTPLRICSQGGTFGAIPGGTTVVATVSPSDVVQLTSVAGLDTGSQVTVAGNARRVVRVDPVASTVQLENPVYANAGQAVTSQDPAFISIPSNAKPVDVQVFANPGTFTWTNPGGAETDIDVFGSGGGGAGGAVVASGTACSGGGGGGGGTWNRRRIRTALIGSTYQVQVGAGGVGGAGAAAAGAGGDGAVGGVTSFGTGISNKLCLVYGGGGGKGGQVAGHAGGGGGAGRILAGGSGTAAAGGSGGAVGGGTGGFGSNSSTLSAFAGTGGGGGTNGAAGGSGGSSDNGATGGGAGGGVSTTPAAFAGGGAGTTPLITGASGTGVGAATPAAPSLAEGAPNVGGAGGSSSIAGNGVGGQVGGQPGGGGGGGGSALAGSTAGSGAKGGDGLIVVTTWS